MKLKNPQLILPAGNFEKLTFALEYGADAVYGGLPPFSMRSRVNEFTQESYIEGRELARRKGKRFFTTLNISPRNNKIMPIEHHIDFLRDKIKPDAIIIADPGVFSIVKERWPKARIHLSVQANTVNWRSAQFWYEQGVSRIVLARELFLTEIAEIKKRVPALELEVFVHGSICMAYSGRCLISNYQTGRDSNQGVCSHSCRYKYKVYLEEETRPGQYYPLEEDKHGSYLFNAKDICAIELLPELRNAGVDGFKIEGRSKTIFYLATVCRAYRKAIDDMAAGKPFDPALRQELDKIANRGYSKEYLKRTMATDSIDYENRDYNKQKFIGVVRERLHKGLYKIEIRNRIEQGEEVECFGPTETKKLRFDTMLSLEREPINMAHGGAGEILLKTEETLPVSGLLRKVS